MRSPFPGMDPYLERHWLDVHARLVTYAADALNERLPPGLVATTEERVAVETEEDRLHRAGPDVSVFGPTYGEKQSGAMVIDAPYRLVIDLDPITEHYIRILDSDGERLITVVEFLSPTNKIGEGLEDYRRKRSELLAAGVSVVEVDLSRRGDWRRLLRPHACPPEAATAYRALVHMSRPQRAVYLYPISLLQPLPEISVPLRLEDTPVRLPLQPLVDQVYQRGRYSQRLHYAEPPDPPMEAEDLARVRDMLKAAQG